MNIEKSTSHILFSRTFDAQGKAHKVNGKEASTELIREGLTWIHLDANSDFTKKWLEHEVFYLDHLIIDALTAEETRPRIAEFDDGLLIILRAVNLNKNSQADDMVSIRIWIDSERLITVQRRDSKAVFNVLNRIDLGKVIKNSGELLYGLLYEILAITAPFLHDLNEKIDDLEKKLMISHDAKLREQILEIRFQSTAFKRYLVPQKDVIAKLLSCNYHWMDEWAQRHFQENFDMIAHMVEEADEARDRSQILHDELSNALTSKLNKSMYKLSLISSIFMPLTFLTGLLGMNIGGVPGVGESSAFTICVITMVTLTAMQILFLKRKDWFK
jgi:zinc transporter